MKTYEIKPEHEFAFELKSISDENLQWLCLAALDKAPDYFWFLPSSSSGKHHPRTSLGMGGLVRHVKSVVRVAILLLDNPLFALKEFNRDYIIVACILHDCLKQGLGEPTHTVHEHPLLVREHLKPDNLSEHQEIAWNAICDLIDTHMGPWVNDSYKRSTVVLPLPETAAQRFVHMCDYLGSRKDIEIDVADRVAQQNYDTGSKSNDDAWKKDPIQPAQQGYLDLLTAKCIARNLKPMTATNKGEASDAITIMKAMLGIK